MPRPIIASLPLLASLVACSAPARTPTTTNHAPSTVYTLMPVGLGGGEGRHSASHSSTGVNGTLEISGGEATLSLAFDTFIGHVRCPEEMRTGRVYTMQQCASDDMKDTSTTSSLVLRGQIRTEYGTMIVDLRTGRDGALEMTCRESFLGLACTIDSSTLFQSPGDVPHSLAFMTPGAKRFAITPTDVKDVGRVAGTLDITGGTISLALGVDGGPLTVLPGHATYHDHGIVLTAQTSPTRNLSAVCKVDADRLKCEVTGDRSILGKPEHIYSDMVLVPARAVPTRDAQLPARVPSRDASIPARAPSRS
jgi:hypothetical protein